MGAACTQRRALFIRDPVSLTILEALQHRSSTHILARLAARCPPLTTSPVHADSVTCPLQRHPLVASRRGGGGYPLRILCVL
ncbi:hypothetical protein NDU88_004275 [Pleurodeles waltl]|uniref:Uncharacterized protein n=1 Tax=Pleurodeles waltl TaxID=8319 RepID=A0AAV7UGN7_PLEWA|nr:hypothetical protein NDU88_004275 [Pleurodeles waltl]